ncbi:MAG TPA: hypothetical protein ENK83_05150 [Aliiroseovarius sp.]|nr:hypothetical protein [Aliiroseovarius sp.]
MRAVAEMQARAREPERFARLHKVIQYELGHDVAFAVENAKISANAQAAEGARVKLGFVEPGLGAEFGLADMDASLAGTIGAITDCARAVLKDAEIPPERVDHVVFVGGSSLLKPVSGAIQAVFRAQSWFSRKCSLPSRTGWRWRPDYGCSNGGKDFAPNPFAMRARYAIGGADFASDACNLGAPGAYAGDKRSIGPNETGPSA